MHASDVAAYLSSFEETLPLYITLYNFILCIFLSFLIKFVYIKYSNAPGSLSLSNLLPVLAGIVFLVIAVIKSSLALSLGLVGALSIVRFRTPIKEPEELIYLFFIIAMSIGMSAGYNFVTIIITILILVIILINHKLNFNKAFDYNVLINTPSNFKLDDIDLILQKTADEHSLTRADYQEKGNNFLFAVSFSSSEDLNNLNSKLIKLSKTIKLNIFKNTSNW